MFSDSENRQIQYCPMCEEWADKCEKLKNAIKEIKNGAAYVSANSKYFLHNIFEEIIKICNESEAR